MPPFNVVGTTIPRIEGPSKVTGQARFAADIQLPGILSGKILRSPYPHARIRSIDLGPALALPGVVAAVAGTEIVGTRHGKNIKDMPGPGLGRGALSRRTGRGSRRRERRDR